MLWSDFLVSKYHLYLPTVALNSIANKLVALCALSFSSHIRARLTSLRSFLWITAAWTSFSVCSRLCASCYPAAPRFVQSVGCPPQDCTQSLSFLVHSNWEIGASESKSRAENGEEYLAQTSLARGRASRSLQSLNYHEKRKGLRADNPPLTAWSPRVATRESPTRLKSVLGDRTSYFSRNRRPFFLQTRGDMVFTIA